MKQLIQALIKAQGEFPAVVKDSTNPHFKNRYADLDTVCSTVNPVLRANGLIVVQTAEGDGLRTTLWHESGESITGIQTLHPAKLDPQGFHGAMTYSRRYQILGLLGISSSDDDDGNTASKKPESKLAPTRHAEDADPEKMTVEQLRDYLSQLPEGVFKEGIKKIGVRRFGEKK
jgi:hypothetical protein